MEFLATGFCNARLPELDAFCDLPIHSDDVEHHARNHAIEDAGLWDVYWQGEPPEPGAS